MTRLEVIQLDHWRYKIDITTDDHHHIVTLPDSNWYSIEQVKRVIADLGCTCIDVCSVHEQDKLFLLGALV